MPRPVGGGPMDDACPRPRPRAKGQRNKLPFCLENQSNLLAQTSKHFLSTIWVAACNQSEKADKDARSNKSNNDTAKQPIANVDAKHAEEPATDKRSDQTGNNVPNDPITNPTPHDDACQKTGDQTYNQPPDQTLKRQFCQDKARQCHNASSLSFEL